MSDKQQRIIAKKPDKIAAHAEIMAEVACICISHYISIGFGFERKYVKGQWTANQSLDVGFLVDVFKECPQDTIKDNDCNMLLYIRDRLDSFAQACKDSNVHYFWVISYEKRVFYDLDHVGDTTVKNPNIAWHIQLFSPGYVEKKIRAPKEPIREALLALNNLPRGQETTDDLGDLTEFVNQLHTVDEWEAEQTRDK